MTNEIQVTKNQKELKSGIKCNKNAMNHEHNVHPVLRYAFFIFT